MRTTAVCLICLPGSYHPGGRAEVTQLSHQLEQAAPCSVQSRSQLAIYRLPLSQQESLSTGYACSVDKVTVVCPILTIPSRYVTFFTDIFAPACWRDSTLGCWREPELPGENLVFHQALLHCLIPDQPCHQEEIGSNVRGSQCQA